MNTNQRFLVVLVLVISVTMSGCVSQKFPPIEYTEIPIPENAKEDTVGYEITIPWNHGEYPELMRGTFTEGPYKGYEIMRLHYFIIDDKNPDTAKFYKDKLLPLEWELIEESNQINRYGSLDNILVWKRERQIIYIVTYQHPLANLGNDTTIMAIGLFAK